MSEADIKIAAYTDAMAICRARAVTYGPIPAMACVAIERDLEDRIKEILEREMHKAVVEAL